MNKKRWNKLSLVEQLANAGSEVERAIIWRSKNNSAYSQLAFYRCLELIDLILADPKNRQRLREVARLREVLVDYFFGQNEYASSDSLWRNYFLAFNYKVRINI